MANRGPGAFGAFGLVFAFGAAQAIYGAALPSLEARFDVGSDRGGMLLAAVFAGAFLGIAVSGALVRRAPEAAQIGVSAGALALGCVVSALAPSWGVAMAGAFAVGLGQGGLDVGLNNAFPRAFGVRAPSLLNVLHACFGLGAIAGPLGVAVLPDGAWRGLFAACAVIAVVTALPGLTLVRGLAPSARLEGQARSNQGGLVAAFATLFVLYVALEATMGGLTATYLVDGFGRSEDAGAAATAAFWVAFTAGRFVGAGLAARVAPAPLVAGGVALGALALTGMPFSATAVPAIALAGFLIAPVFPTGVAWIHQTAADAPRATAVVIGASALGGVGGPLGSGLLVESAGAEALPFLLIGLGVATAAAALALRARARPAARPLHPLAVPE